jgi:hypothetical protein
MSKTNIRKNGDGWIRLQYRQMNTYQWITLHIFKGYELKYVFLQISFVFSFFFHKYYEIITINDCSTSTYSRFSTT